MRNFRWTILKMLLMREFWEQRPSVVINSQRWIQWQWKIVDIPSSSSVSEKLHVTKGACVACFPSKSIKSLCCRCPKKKGQMKKNFVINFHTHKNDFTHWIVKSNWKRRQISNYNCSTLIVCCRKCIIIITRVVPDTHAHNKSSYFAIRLMI